MAAATLAQYNPTTAGAKTPAQIDMLVKGTQDMIIKRGELVNLMTDLTEYVGVNQLWKKHQAAFDGGLDWEFDLLLDQNHTAKFVGLYQDDTANHVEATIKGKVGPKFLNANYVYDVKEKALQSNRAIVIYNFIKGKMSQMYQSWYDLMEDAIWGAPAHKADALTPYGLKFWITRMRAVDPSTSTAYTASQIANGGFFGIDPQLATSAANSALSDVSRAGISSDSYPRWANWATQYAAVTKDDLIRKMRRAFRSVDFKSPVTQVTEPTLGGASRGIYVNLDTITELENILESQNMDLGNDIASKDGKCMFKGYEVQYAPKLNDDAGAPVYLINWKTLALGVLSGWREKLSEPVIVPNQHDSRQVFLDGSMNMICTNLRTQAVISKSEA